MKLPNYVYKEETLPSPPLLRTACAAFQRKPLKHPKGPLPDPVLLVLDLHGNKMAPHTLSAGASVPITFCGVIGTGRVPTLLYPTK